MSQGSGRSVAKKTGTRCGPIVQSLLPGARFGRVSRNEKTSCCSSNNTVMKVVVSPPRDDVNADDHDHDSLRATQSVEVWHHSTVPLVALAIPSVRSSPMTKGEARQLLLLLMILMKAL